MKTTFIQRPATQTFMPHPCRSLMLLASLLFVHPSSPGQPPLDSNPLHARIHGQTYTDDRIRLRAPHGWHLQLFAETVSGSRSFQQPAGLQLRRSGYVLTICTGCQQASGIVGGRFAEIAAMVQPWARTEEPSLPCGSLHPAARAGRLQRMDFVATNQDRVAAPDTGPACRLPRSPEPHWYGSYYAQPLSPGGEHSDSGYFVDLDSRMSHNHPLAAPPEQMVIGLSRTVRSLDELPSPGNPGLRQVEREADRIVQRIHLR